MASDDEFVAAQDRVRRLARPPAANELLALYGLFKQATVGDVQGKRPGILDMKGRAKFDAWQRRKGESREVCQHEYVELVRQLEAKYGSG
jgi:diazepam-binding inhibitor (GABA receptor modulating acyl-CoA-binding protein)